METCFNYCDKDVAFFSSDERKWITRIRKLKQKFPDRVTILAEPENNDGCIYCKLPPSALKVQLFEKRAANPEAMARLQAGRMKHQQKKTDSENNAD